VKAHRCQLCGDPLTDPDLRYCDFCRSEARRDDDDFDEERRIDDRLASQGAEFIQRHADELVRELEEYLEGQVGDE
jgi:hypothetical protein